MSTWGDTWGTCWGDTWGAVDAAAPVTGGGGRRVHVPPGLHPESLSDDDMLMLLVGIAVADGLIH